MIEVLKVVGIVILLVAGGTFVAFLWGFFFGRGFFSGMNEYFNKLKNDKNEQEENQ